MRWDFVVLGATGMQGRIVSKDLLESGYSVLLCGRDKSRLEGILKKYKSSKFEYIDVLHEKQLLKTLKASGAKVVVNCVEGDWNINILKACVSAGMHSIDLGSDIPMTKEQLNLAPLLKKKGLVHITGCGSVPGIGNVMLNHAAKKFDKIKDVEVGFAWDSNIKEFVVPFSIQSIVEEFTALAPYVSHKKIVKVRPMDSLVTCYHRGVGREKQFNVGHHPETYTFYRFCRDKGIDTVKFFAGFPDHSFDKINDFIKLGLASKDEVEVAGTKIVPLNVLTESLKNIEIPKNYRETENLWVSLQGDKKKILMECIVPTLKGWEDAGCNVDTGMPASIMAQMIYKGEISQPGSYAPEDIVPVESFFKELRKRRMSVYENGKLIN